MSLSAVLCRHAGIVGYWFSFLLSCKVVYYDSSASPIAPSLSSSFVARVRTLRCSPSPTPAVASVLINGMMRFDTIATSSSEDDKRFSIFDRVPNPFFAARPLYLSSLPQSHYTQRTYHKSHSSALHRRRRSAFIISEEQRDDRHLQFSRKPRSYIQSTDSIDIVV